MNTETYDDIDYEQDVAPPVNALALQPSRLPMSKAIADEFGIDAPTWRVLVDQTFPAAKTIEAVLMALSYCRARKLDIFKKPVHIVPMWSSAKRAMVETVWPGIAEIRTTAARTGEYAGIDAVEFGPMADRVFKGRLEVWENKKRVWKDVEKTVRYPEWASVVVYRMTHNQRFAYHAKVFWDETYAKMGRTEIPNEMWEKRARGQLDKCVEAAALRKAFPEEVGNMYAAEEMEGRTIDATPAPTETPTPPPAPIPPPAPTPADIAGDFNDDDSGVHPLTDQEFIDQLDADLMLAKDAVTVEEVFDGADVQVRFTDGAWLDKAFAVKAKHLDRVTEKPFPGDLPQATKDAVRRAGTI